VRLFVALNLPDSTRPEVYEAIAPLRRAAPSVRWVLPETLHITLKFLGEVPTQDLEQVLHSLRGAAGSAREFTLQLGGLGAFPNLRRPRVFWLGASGAGALPDLQARVESELETLGFEREARPFHPHLTLGRVGQPLPSEELRQAERATAEVEYQTAVEVRSVELMQSRLSRGGARYEIVERVPLHKRS